MRKMKKTLALLAIVAMVLTMIPFQVFAADSTRLAGADRISTAIAIADAFGSADTVILAAADDANLVDSLAVAPLAGKVSPIYLTYKNSLDAAVKAKLSGKKVIAIGAVSDAVVADAKTVAASVEKVSGADRLATNDLINAKLATSPAGTFVVGYNAIPDALSVASFAAANNYAIVLANPDGSVDSAKIKGSTVYIIGGPTLVKTITGATRLFGADRFATNLEVVKTLTYSYDKVYIANGNSLVDALAASSLAAKAGAAILLTDNVTVKAADYVNGKIGASSVVTALGGTGVVSDAVKGKVVFKSTTPETAEVTVASYDNDTSNQYVAFKVNGQTADVDTLNADGWDVLFEVFTSKTGGGTPAPGTFFADDTTGLLETNIPNDDYYVQVTLTKGSDIVISNRAKVTIKNLNLVATSVTDYELTNHGADCAIDLANPGNAVNDDNFTMDSTTLVTNEQATFTEITISNGSAKEDIDDQTQYSVSSSNAGVVSVTGDTITAQGPGTATVTIKYASVTKAVSITVNNSDREAKKTRVKNTDDKVITSITVIMGNPKTVTAVALDQYGDQITGHIDGVESTNPAVATVAIAGNNVTITPVGAGKTVVSFYNGATKIAGTLNVTVSDEADVAKYKLEIWTPATGGAADDYMFGSAKSDYTDDLTIDKADDLFGVLNLNQYNVNNVSMGNVAPDDVTVTESKTGVVTAVVQADNSVLVTGEKTGTATVGVKFNGTTYSKKFTVVDTAYSIKSVDFKALSSPDYAKTFNYKSVLNITTTGNDPIIKGVNLNKAVSQEIRMDTGNGQIYIDKDGDGNWSAGDTDLGSLVIVTTGTIGGVGPQNITDVGTGIQTQVGDDGTIIFKVLNPAGDKVRDTTSVKVTL
jgi:putative cell wall-binding protein